MGIPNHPDSSSHFHYLASDHDRLDKLLRRATAASGTIDLESYNQFREGLLRHIAMEERALFPAVTRLTEGEHAAVLARLRLDHGALAALLVPPPDPAIVATLRSILAAHNATEEQEAGVYRLMGRLADSEKDELLQTLKGIPEVPLAPFNDKPGVLDATRRALARAGYVLQEPPL